jgi:NADPH-dependent 2,4-dienoyl-CoA reductase/sulfur reductase-like enzyme
MDAGFDAIELQFGHGYLLSQFLSLHTNKRQDQYGGTWQNRARFGLEILQKIRDKLEPDFPVIVRISGEEYFEGGLKLDDSIRLTKELEHVGASAIHVGGGSACETLPWYFQQMSLPMGKFWQDAFTIKKEIRLPVIAVGRINDIQDMAHILSHGIDYLAMARPLVADPDMPQKIQSGNTSMIRRCTACLEGCFTKLRQGEGLHCALNPIVGREGEIKIEKVKKAKTVFIVGGGVAGMEAGIIAAQRGHRVELFEKDQLGGQYNLASLPPGKKSLEVVKDNMVAVLEQLGVSVTIGKEITVDDILKAQPDSIIIATGAQPITPELKGLATNGNTATAFSVLDGSFDPGNRVLVIGGGLIGMETTEFMAKQGKEVTVIEMLPETAGDMELLAKKLMEKRMTKLPVTILTATTIVEFTEDDVIINTPTGRKRLPKFDSIVLAVGTKSQKSLVESLKKKDLSFFVIGDAKEPRNGYEAIHEGFEVGYNL